MLLELLEHHESLFCTILSRFIEARDARTMAALSAVNWRLNAALAADSWWQHRCKMRFCLGDINRINYIYNNYMALREYNDNLHEYILLGYTNSSRYTTVSYYYSSSYFTYNYNTKKGYLLDHHYNIINIKSMGRRIINNMCICVIGEIPQWINKYNNLRVTNDPRSGFDFII
jgi:hypothetical protein